MPEAQYYIIKTLKTERITPSSGWVGGGVVFQPGGGGLFPQYKTFVL